MRKRLKIFGYLLFYLFFVGGIPTLVLAISFPIASFLDFYLDSAGVFTFTIPLIALAVAVAVAVQCQKFFVKKFPQYSVD